MRGGGRGAAGIHRLRCLIRVMKYKNDNTIQLCRAKFHENISQNFNQSLLDSPRVWYHGPRR